MVGLIVLFLATLVGYLVTVACALVFTMALTAGMPGSSVRKHRVMAGYKWLHEVLWFVAVVIGSVCAARVSLNMQRSEQELVLAGVLIFMLWWNAWEARQRGTLHQLLISLFTLAGVFVGFGMEARWH